MENQRDGIGIESKKRIIFYWILTGYLGFANFAAGVMDFAHMQPFYGMLLRLGYPPILSNILGFWKILAVAAILVPRMPVIKEWAYAGLFFEYSSATISHIVAGDGPGKYLMPIFGIALIYGSWALRPESRRPKS